MSKTEKTDQKILKNKILKKLFEIDKMVEDGTLDIYEAARIKDKVDPVGIGLTG